MAFYLEQHTGAECTVKGELSHVTATDDSGSSLPKLVLVECPEKDPNTCLDKLEKIDKEIMSNNRVALFNVIPGLGIEEKAVALGVRGIFYNQDPIERFSKGVGTMFDGELWLSREILSRYVMRDRKEGSVSRQEEAVLTTREIEILTMISAGAKNEKIAEKLCISPNTVKTHIYNIFKKIDVPNRLQAALWAAKNL